MFFLSVCFFLLCIFECVCIVYRTTIHIILNFNCIFPSRARTHTNTLDASNTSMLFGLGQRPAQKLLRSVFFCSEKNIRGSPKTANYLQINYLCSSKMERKRESVSHVISLHNESRVRTLQVHIIYGFEFRWVCRRKECAEFLVSFLADVRPVFFCANAIETKGNANINNVELEKGTRTENYWRVIKKISASTLQQHIDLFNFNAFFLLHIKYCARFGFAIRIITLLDFAVIVHSMNAECMRRPLSHLFQLCVRARKTN